MFLSADFCSVSFYLYFPPVQTDPGAHLASFKMGTGSFLGGRGGRGVGLTPHPHLVPKVLEKNTAVPLLTLRDCVVYKKGETVPTFLPLSLHLAFSSSLLISSRLSLYFNLSLLTFSLVHAFESSVAYIFQTCTGEETRFIMTLVFTLRYISCVCC